ncbi:hypothetical protein [Altererythrobacter sp. GH1-8]|uniref:hypothetical protein n=1 Tax=Altererythrobacter sp. GH1-8 TaxID=3349333 RepID=UPI00374D74BC
MQEELPEAEFYRQQSLLSWLYALESTDLAIDYHLDFARSLVEHENPDIQEIAIMRLACRAYDRSIEDKVFSVMEGGIDPSSDWDLVYSACVCALVCLSTKYKFRTKAREVLEKAKRMQTSADRISYIDTALSDLG